MKYRILFFIVILTSPQFLNGQSCLPDGIIFTSQSEIDSFPYNYPSCSEIEGFVTIGPLNSWDEIDISNLDSLISINSILGDLLVWNNDLLANLSGLDSLSYVGGDLLIETNSSVENLEGLEGLTSVGGMLRIYGGNYITSLDGLDNLVSIGGDLSISYSNALADISSLLSLSSMNGELTIFSNASLTSLTGLNNIDAAFITALSITNNSLLATCEVESVCNYLIENGMNVSVNNNASGCNSDIQITNACFNGLSELSNSELKIYPNPANDHIVIEGFDQYVNTKISLIDQLGRKVNVNTHNGGEIDISDFNEGLYFLQIENENFHQQVKFIIER